LVGKWVDRNRPKGVTNPDGIGLKLPGVGEKKGGA